MFSFIRSVLSIIFFGILFLLIKKLKLEPLRRYIVISAILSALFLTVIGLIPFENAFCTFDSPQQVYNYSNPDGKIIEVISGKYCDFFVIDKGTSQCSYYAEKSENGWKLSGFSASKNAASGTNIDNFVFIQQYKNTSDYFICIHHTNMESAEISDNLNSSFIEIPQESTAIGTKPYIYYYAYLDGYNENYELTIDGETIKLLKQ